MAAEISNPENAINRTLWISIGLATEWASSICIIKSNCKIWCFPEGIMYDHKKNYFTPQDKQLQACRKFQVYMKRDK